MSGIMSMVLGAKTAIAQAVDAYFNLVSLLLPGDGTNGAQNNTFLDSSSNNFSITRNPTSGPNAPTQGTFSPFSQTGWSNYFDGSGDYLTVPDNTAFDFGSGNFTIECWVYPTVWGSTAVGILGKRATTASANQIGLEFSGSTGIVRFAYNNAGSEVIVAASTGTLNAWQHIAAVRNGNTLTIYQNGVSTATATINVSITANTAAVALGTVSSDGSFLLTGYISNFRIVKGTAVYTSAFTPPTAPLTAITNTSLLTCQDNRFRDASSNAFAVTVNGNPSVQAFSPFAPTAAYSAATNGGSGYFDGTGDYLSLPSNAAFNIFGGDMTVECWFYQTSTTNTAQHLLAFVESSTLRESIYFSAANTLSFWSNGGSTGATRISATGIVPNTWHHFALVKSGSTFTMYINGSSVGTSTTTAYSTANQVMRIATYDGATTNDLFAGYISGVRVIKSQALTSGNFTPPTSAVTTSSVGWTGANVASSITGTVSVLANFTNAGITDATAKNDLETVGNAQISTTQSKWGGSSMSFDGTTNTRLVPSTNNIGAFGTGDFVIEFFIRFNAVNAAQVILDFRSASSSVAPVIALKNTGVIYYYTGGASPGERITGSTLSANTWYYVAVARASGTTRMYVDGSQVGSNYTDSNNYVGIAGRPWVGNLADGSTPAQNLNAYIDDLRITRGNARGYTGSTITVPTAAFALQ